MKRAFIAVLLASACGPYPAKEIGAQLFAHPGVSSAENNAFSCATCHDVDEGDAIKSGHRLDDSMFRTAFWGEQVRSPLEAMNVCVTFFMQGKALEADEPKARALYEYLASISSKEDKKPRKLTMIENVTTVPRGSASKGRQVWDNACRECHGDPHTANGAIRERMPKVPEDSEAFAKQLRDESGLDVTADLVIVEKVRHGRFFGVGGTMPPFSKESLSDDELGQILGYLDAKP